MRDSLAPERLGPLLGGRLGKPYLYHETCESTQQLLDVRLPEGATAVCEAQTRGRGRLGRTWEAPAAAAILVSVLLRPPGGRTAAELSLVAGLAAALTVERATGLAAQIKWPNDVMLDRRKVAGILAETREQSVVVGIGLNVNQRRDELPLETSRTPPGSLYTIDGVRRNRAPLLADLLESLESGYDTWRDAGLEALYPDIGARDFLRGRRVTVEGNDGTCLGIERDGRLAVELAGERRVIESGEVSYDR